MSDYHDEFLRESREQITELNNALLALESDPDDGDAMDAVFRTAHTLKGNAAAMGFDGISELAHAVEDLLDEVRNDRLDVTPERMDLTFAGVDRIETALGDLEEHGEIDVDTSDLAADIRDAIGDDDGAGAEGNGDEASAAAGDDADAGGAIPTAELLDALSIDPSSVDGPVAHARVAVDEDGMKGVDAMLVFDALTDSIDVLGSRPARDDIESGEFDGGFDLVTGGETVERLSTVLEELSPVTDATVTDVPEGEEPADVTDATDAGDEEPVDEPDLGDESGFDWDDGTADEGPDGDDDSDDTKDGGDSDGSDDGDGPGSSVDDVKSVRVDVDQLDELHGLVEQLVTSRIKLRRALQEEEVGDARDSLGELDKISTHLQDTVMDMQLVPLRKVVGKFPRLVRDLARDQDKDVNFRLEGEDIELDRTILTRISDPLMHVLRNSVDHGIEPPDEREAAGKPREGTVELRARREGDHVFIVVEDDGRGLDVDAIREKAAEEGIRSSRELDEMDDSDVYDLVFHPGFSTNDEVTGVSGRGVGMDVVHSTVKRLDGSVDVASERGEGTTVTLRLPVTVAIVTVLFVRVGGQRFGVPLKAIDEVGRATDVRTANGREIVEHNDDLYPVIRLADALDVEGPAERNGDGMLVRIRESERQAVLYCDAVEDQAEVVVKPLEGILSGTEGMSGTAVLGDGNIVPILDVMTL